MLHQIGVGALGPVFRTYEPTRDRLVAVKVFRLDITPEQAKVLADELAKATEAGLFHPSIVEPVAAGLEGTVAYRAEEYVAAESLDVAMRHYAPASLDKALPFITQLAAAIDFARAAGVGHGALHPRDIFVTPDEARATGFGVVDALDRLGHRAPVRRPYSPPERIAGERWGIAADVFSLAVIAFELLTARRPSGIGDQMGPLTGATLGDHADAIREVLVKAMHENPADRYASAGAFATALAQAAGVEAAAPAAAVPADAVPAERVPTEPLAATPVEAGLEDFAAEPLEQLPGESAREVARKVIAARKRQKREPERPAPEASPAETVVPPPIVAEPEVPEPIVAETVAPETITHEAVGPETTASSPVVPEPIIFEPIVAEERAPEPLAFEEVAFEPVASEPVAPTEDAPLATFEQSAAAASMGIRESGPREIEPVVRDTSDRVVAVDEFRLRDVTPLRPERPRHRSHDRVVPERTIAPASTATPVESLLDRGDTDVHHVPHEEPHAERPRIAMLPLAMMLIPGLVLAYIAGYVVGSRDSRAEQSPIAQSAPPATSPPLSTPGTSGQTPPPKDFSEAAVSAPKPAAEPVGERKPTSTPSPAPKTGQIVVTSSPSKAQVTVNGEWSGRTPLTLNRPFGAYNIRVVEKGFEIERQQVQLSANAPKKTVDVTLRPTRTAAGATASTPAPTATKPAPIATKPAPTATRPAPAATRPAPAATKPAPGPAGVTTGEIFVDSRPQGARVLIDGKLQGVTPLRLTNQAAGSYAVRLELTDHQPWTDTTRVTPGGVARVTGSLERIR